MLQWENVDTLESPVTTERAAVLGGYLYRCIVREERYNSVGMCYETLVSSSSITFVPAIQEGAANPPEKTFTVSQLRGATKELLKTGRDFKDAVEVCARLGLDSYDNGLACMLWLLCDQGYIELHLWANGKDPDGYIPGDDNPFDAVPPPYPIQDSP